MEVNPHCYLYDKIPITFDIDRVVVSLTGKGYPTERLDKQMVEKYEPILNMEMACFMMILNEFEYQETRQYH